MRRIWCVSVAAFAFIGVGGAMLAAAGAGAATHAAGGGGHFVVRPGGVAAHVVPSAAGQAGVRRATSENWSGYAVHSGTYTSVSASWTEPTANCSKGNGYAAFWIGLDGYSSQTVEQTGTDSDCHGGKPHYYGWWEMYPAFSVNLSKTVKPGNRLSASVSYDGSGRFTLKLTDSTEGWTATETKTLKSAKRSSAEVIIEAPSSTSGELPLSDFGTVHFTASTVDGHGIGGLHPTKITMVYKGRQLDKVTALSGGTSFSGTWLAR
jgi:hypothetical protein